MIWKPETQNLVIAAQNRAKARDEHIRRGRAAKAIDYYNDEQWGYVYDEIQRRHRNTYDDLVKYIVEVPITRAIVNQLAKVFQRTPSINIDGGDVIKEALTKTISICGLFSKLKMADRLAETCYIVGIKPIWNKAGRKVYLDIITPDNCFIQQLQLTRDTTDIAALYVSVADMDQTPGVPSRKHVYEYWSNDEYGLVELGLNGKIINTWGVEPNPYGRIPVAWFRIDHSHETFWPERGYPIVNCNQRANIQLSMLDLALEVQGFATLVTEGMKENDTLTVGLKRYINIPYYPELQSTPGKAYYIASQTDLKKIFEVINDNIAMTASLMGISADTIRQGADFASGYQLRISKADVIQHNIDKQSIYADGTRELVQLIMDCERIANAVNYPKDANLSVIFAAPEVESSELEDEQINALRLNMKTITRSDIIKKRHPYMTTAEAEEYARRAYTEGADNTDTGETQ